MDFKTAKQQYVYRFTMEHVPAWAAKRPCDSGGNSTKYYAPQYASDREWYENTKFPPDPNCFGSNCHTAGQTWPLGQWLDAPYKIRKGVAA